MPLSFDDPSIVFDVVKGTILEASAGSGKTTILTERWLASFIYLIVWEKKSVSEALNSMVALTFTKKAASEMKIRIRNRLSDLWDSGELESFLEEIKQYIGDYPDDLQTICRFLYSLREQIEDLLSSAVITTISAYVLQLLHMNPLELSRDIASPEDQGYDFSITEQESQQILLQRLLSKFYQDSMSQKSFELGVSLCGLSVWNKLFVQLRKLISDFGTHAILEALSKSSYLQYQHRIIEILSEENQFASIFDIIKPVIHDLIYALDEERTYNKNKLISSNEVLYKNLKQITADNLLPLFTKNLLGEYKLPAKETTNEELNYYRQQSFKAYQHFIDTLYQIMLPLLLPVSDQCSELVREKQEQTQEISFSESEFLLLDVLQNKHLLEKIQSRMKFFFADEYQDTSDIQKNIFDLILSADHIVPFFVGDPKQSIYRFRQANVYIFQKTVDEFNSKNYKTAFLNTNYRSASTHVQLVNDLFESIFLDDPSGIVYQDQLSKKEEAGDFGYTLALGAEDGEKYTQNERDKHAYQDALKVIHRYINDGINPGDIMVLFRENFHILEFYDIAKTYFPSIPLSSSVKNIIWDNNYIVPLISFLQAVVHPYHNLTIVELLKTPFFRKTDEEIINLLLKSQNLGKSLFEILSDHERNLLEQFVFLKDRISLEELISTVIKELHYEDILMGLPKSGDALATLRLFVEESKKIQQKRGMSLGEFLVFINEKKPKADEAEFSGEEGKTLRLMTIHKSKGLESPYVIYVHKSHSGEKRVRFPQYQNGYLSFDVLGKGMVADNVSLLVKQEETCEEKRLAYVAVTRAKTSFVFCGLPSGVKKDKMFETQWESFFNRELVDQDNRYKGCLLSLPEISQQDHKIVIDDNQLYLDRFNELERNQEKFEALPQFLSVSLLLDAEFNPQEFYQKYHIRSFDILESLHDISEKDNTISSLNLMDIGSLVHELLQKFDAVSIDQINLYLKQQHVDKQSIFPVVIDYVYAYWNSAFYQKFIKSSSHQEKERQVICMIDEGIMIRAAVDSYVSLEDHKNIIVDYKLSVSSKNLDRYVRQLSYYALLFEMAGHRVDEIFLFNLKEGKEYPVQWDRDKTKEYFFNSVKQALILLNGAKIETAPQSINWELRNNLFE